MVIKNQYSLSVMWSCVLWSKYWRHAYLQYSLSKGD